MKAAQRARKYQYGGVGQATAGGNRVRLVAAQAGQQLRDHGPGVVALDEVDGSCQPGAVGDIDLIRSGRYQDLLRASQDQIPGRAPGEAKLAAGRVEGGRAQRISG